MGLDSRIGPSSSGGSDKGAPASRGCLRPQAASRQHGLPLPAAHRRHRGQRASEAAHDHEAPKTWARWSASRSPCSGSPSSRRRTTSARRRRSCSPPGFSRRRAHVRAFARSRAARAAGLLHEPTSKDSAIASLDGADAAVPCHRWPDFRDLDWSEVKERMTTPVVIDGRNFLDRELLEQGGFTYEGVGRSQSPSLGHRLPRLRQALVLAAVRDALRPLTLTRPSRSCRWRAPVSSRSFCRGWLATACRRRDLSCGHMSDAVERILGRRVRGIELHHVVEEEKPRHRRPGPARVRPGPAPERLFVLNGDCLADLDLTAELDYHFAKGRRARSGLVAVDDTSATASCPPGLRRGRGVSREADGPVPTNRINAAPTD